VTKVPVFIFYKQTTTTPTLYSLFSATIERDSFSLLANKTERHIHSWKMIFANKSLTNFQRLSLYKYDSSFFLSPECTCSNLSTNIHIYSLLLLSLSLFTPFIAFCLFISFVFSLCRAEWGKENLLTWYWH
jgi:hypothetical protein